MQSANHLLIEYIGDMLQHLTEGGHLESLTEAVIVQHSTLAGLAQGTAEEYYILAAQQLDCYGQETFLAKVLLEQLYLKIPLWIILKW